jgi:hypothetical protein
MMIEKLERRHLTCQGIEASYEVIFNFVALIGQYILNKLHH